MLICPYCGSENYRTVNSRNNNLDTLYVNRRKLCNNCNTRFTTVEITKELFDNLVKKEKILQNLDAETDKYEAVKDFIKQLDKEGESE